MTQGKLPKNAKKVFKGKIFDVWQWEQRMFDGSTEIFEKLARPNTECVIAVVGDKILIQKQEQPDREPFTSFPGGRNDQNEDEIVAAKRELLEETGYASNDIFLWREKHPISKMEWSVNYFIARDCKKIRDPKLDAGEKITSRLITFDELLMLSEDQTFRDREIISDLFRMRLYPEEKEEFKKLLFG